ncbi:MAG: hypothetical protein LBT86_06290 [Deltaproteobacteria bacterium]|jgi:hypothetical protein|nr:hypothetical protein [Deltaproteobacteria bacterium]
MTKPTLPLLAILTFFGLFLFSNQAQAVGGCDCVTMGSLLKQAAQTVVTGIANPLSIAIERAAGYQTTNLRQELVAIREAILMTQERTTEAIERAEQSQADRQSERTYEPASQPLTNCLNDLLGQFWRRGAPTKDALRAALVGAVTERSARNAKPADYLNEINANPLKTVDFERLWGVAPETLTLSAAELELAANALAEFTDPLPAPALPAAIAETPAGRLYSAAKIDLEKRLALYQGILAQRLTSRAPTLGGLAEWVTRKWTDMGGSGTPPGLVEGYLSDSSLMWYLTNLRLGSDHWHEKILPTLPEAGLLREMVAMTAVQLELSRRQGAQLENLTLLMALEGLERLETRAKPALRNQYRLALGR